LFTKRDAKVYFSSSGKSVGRKKNALSAIPLKRRGLEGGLKLPGGNFPLQ